MTQKNNKPIIIIMTRWPAIGRCKRRLANDIGPTRAAWIQHRLTNHTLSVAKELKHRGLIDLRLGITGISLKIAKRSKCFKGLEIIESQGNGSLGLRMRRLILRAQSQNKWNRKTSRKIILIGSDLPTLCTKDLISSLEALNHYEMVIGPAEDGGYWLLGLSSKLLKPVIHWPFCGIPWGSNKVLNTTTKKADLAGIKYFLLDKKNDLDQLSDLIPWQA